MLGVALMGGLYVLDTALWVGQSDTWLHTDGPMHLERAKVFHAWYLGDGQTDPGPMAGYGPLLYLLTAGAMAVLPATWATGTLVQSLFGALGGVGAGLVGGRLAGPRGALLACAVLLGLPMMRVHTVDFMVDQPSASLTVLAVGMLLWSEGLGRWPWVLGAALATVGALATRWPVAMALGPAWLAAAVWSLRQHGLWRGVRSWVMPSVVVLGLLGWGAHLWWDGLFQQVGAVGGQNVGNTESNDLSRINAWSRVWMPLAMWRTWTLGPVFINLALLGVVVGLIRRASRAATLLVVLAVVCNAGLVWVGLNSPDERHMFASVPLLCALAGAAVGWVPGRAGQVAAVLTGALALYPLAAWRLPGAPGVIAPDHWRTDLRFALTDYAGWFWTGWVETKSPLIALRPFKAGSEKDVAGWMVERFGSGQPCVGWVIDPAVRPHFRSSQMLPKIESQREGLGLMLTDEDVLDRPEAAPTAYDALMVLEADTGRSAAGRVAAAMGPDGVQSQAAPDLAGATLTGVWRTSGWAEGGCGERHAGLALRPLGSGWAEAVDDPQGGWPAGLGPAGP